MQKTIFFILCLICFSACNDDDISISVPTFCEHENCDFDCITDLIPTEVITNDCLDNYECDFKLLTDSKINLNNSDAIVSGNKNVFQLMTSTQGSAQIADDEFTNILIFELDAAQESFSVEGEALENMKVHFRRICFCSETDFISVKIGCMQGKNLESGKWAIQGNLEVEYEFGMFPVLFEAEFE